MSSILKKMKEDLGRIKYEIKKRQYNSLETVHFLANLHSKGICGSCEPTKPPKIAIIGSFQGDPSSMELKTQRKEQPKYHGMRSNDFRNVPMFLEPDESPFSSHLLSHRRGNSFLHKSPTKNFFQSVSIKN
jgi:hypothetical protein